ncbi:MAG: hypothetical protein ACREF3_09365 [Acetobacteraceae bacterium]
MHNRPPHQFDMLIDGTFRTPPRPSLPMRIAGVAIIIAVIAGSLGIVALALSFAIALIPVAVIAAIIAWVAIRFQLWRSGRRYGGPRDLFRR